MLDQYGLGGWTGDATAARYGHTERVEGLRAAVEKAKQDKCAIGKYKDRRRLNMKAGLDNLISNKVRY